MSKRISFVRQHDSMQCGAACLCMIARYFGLNLRLSDAENICDLTFRGVSMWSIVQALHKLGFKTKACRMTIDCLSKVKVPVILFWDQKHFVVFDGVTVLGKYRIADPGKGKYNVDRQTMLNSWACENAGFDFRGMCIIPESGQFKSESVILSNQKGNVSKYILSFFLKFKTQIVLICLGLLLVTIFQLIIPFFTKLIADEGIENKNIEFIWLILLGELMIIIGCTVSDFVRRWLLLHISVRVDIDLLVSFLKKLTRLKMSFFDTRLLGDLMQRASDHYRVQSFLTGETISILFITFNFCALSFALFFLDKIICSIYIIFLVIYAIWIMLFLKKRRLMDFEYFDKNCKNNNLTYEFLSSLSEIKLQGCDKIRCQQWVDSQKDLFKTKLRSLKLTQAQESGYVLINEIKNIIITVMCATAVIGQRITFGDMLAIQYIIGQLNAPASQIISFIYAFQDVRISLERINEIHELDDEDCKRRVSLRFPLKTGIKISNLTFSYGMNSDRKVLSNINLDIPVGKITAIVGLSGSGKTTLMKLLLGFYDRYEGNIEIDGVPLRDVNRYNYRNHCGAVMQDGIIFSDTISRNIASDNNAIDYDKVNEVAESACILDFINSQPLRFDTVIGRNGKGLSQGQKQRILIARALYKRPDILFFDEATNSLDTINENKINENLKKFFINKTVVIIAHRLSTIKNADQIVVMENGKIKEKGNHTMLLEKRGVYYSLIKNQIENLENV